MTNLKHTLSLALTALLFSANAVSQESTPKSGDIFTTLGDAFCPIVDECEGADFYSALADIFCPIVDECEGQD